MPLSDTAVGHGDISVASLKRGLLDKLTYAVGKDQQDANDRDWFVATALLVRDRLVEQWLATGRETREKGSKHVYYLSLEFLIGRLLFDSMTNLGIAAPMQAALKELGVKLDDIRDVEPDAGLGNGGLGRLAACFMESMATLAVPAYGYGIRYTHGLFRQVIKDGWQEEHPENWLNFGNPWEFERPEIGLAIGFGGHMEPVTGPDGVVRQVWRPGETVMAVAYDTPVVGWRGQHVNTLRLWSARSPDPLRLDQFNKGDHVGALTPRLRANAISQILYPGDDTPSGQELRLRQEYFFSSASLQDLIARHLTTNKDLSNLADKAAIQLNDTHPAIAVPEMMRLLVDVHGIDWEKAWEITNGVFSYTNHTLLPEALESWPVPLLERVLPRHMQLIYEINWSHLNELRTGGRAQPSTESDLSIIDENNGRRVRMGTLAFLGSHKVNGVSALHTDLMRKTVFADLHDLYPNRIVNKTNGITFRRWLFEANPALTKLLVEVLGERVLDDPYALEGLAAHADDASLQERLAAIKLANKKVMARAIANRVGLRIDPNALFDVQVKRIHEYKRQILNLIETIALYDQIRARPMQDWVPRVKIFAGKAAPGYERAKMIVKLIHDVAYVINNDPTVRGLLKVVFLPNYNVSLAETIMPAADLSEQISTAGMEASGTGNMKLALNGALTIGTLDGANVEIRERVGEENIFIFGMTAQEVEARLHKPGQAAESLARSPALREVMEAIATGVFSPKEPDRFRGLLTNLYEQDRFMVLADFDSYCDAQRRVASAWQNKKAWWRASALNTARVGWFSSDRTISEYAEDVWKVPTALPTP